MNHTFFSIQAHMQDHMQAQMKVMKKYSLVMCALITMISSPFYLGHALAEDGCAKAQVRTAESCDKVKVTFDLSGCGEKAAENVEAKVKCKTSGAYATAKVGSHRYRVKLKAAEGGWGQHEWNADGVVFRTDSEGNEKTSHSTENENDEGSGSVAASHSHSKSSAKEHEVVKPAVEEPKTSGVQISGLFDAYYSFNFNRPTTTGVLSSASVTGASIPNGRNNVRYYDIYHNKISLSLAELTVKKTGSEVSFLVDFDYGEFADLNVVGTSPSISPSSQVVDEVSKHIGQAFVTYTPHWAPGLVLDIGKMPTHIGYEVMKSRDNWQYSRSTTFGFGSPFWHTGVHVGYAILPNVLTASVYLYNGWNTVYDNNHAKTLGAQVKLTPSDKLSIIYNVISGAEQERNDGPKKTVNEINVVYTPSAKLAFALEMLYGREANVTVTAPSGVSATRVANWTGITAHMKYQPVSWYWFSPRYEYYRDHHGYTLGSGGDQSMHGITLTNTLPVGQGLEFRLEGRMDYSSNHLRFDRSNNTGTSHSQTTVTFATIYTL